MTIRRIYLAGPIDLGTDVNWKDVLVKKIKEKSLPVVTFNPAAAFSVSCMPMDSNMALYIEEINQRALDLADIVICSLPKGVQTVGTIVEIDRAHETRKPLWLLTNIDVTTSAYLINRVDQNKIAYGTADTLDARLNTIIEWLEKEYVDA